MSESTNNELLKEFRGFKDDWKKLAVSVAVLDERSRNQGDILDEIKQKISQPNNCVFHQGIQVACESHAKRIEDLEKQDIRIEAKLSPADKAKLDTASLASKGASLGAIILGVWEIVKFLFKIP